MRSAAAEGRDYEAVTERGAQVHAARQARALFTEMRERLELARETYGTAREAGLDRVSAGLAALRAAAGKDRGVERETEGIQGRLARIVGREGAGRGGPAGKEQGAERVGADSVQERLREALKRDHGVESDDMSERKDDRKPTIRERLEEVLGRARERSEVENRRDVKQDREVKNTRERDRDEDYGL